ncbi:MAG TPA: twin-arginine translocase subunit TatC [Cyclobacteriaceae bacterium]|nr:twin-arginine translocase subunit TatC [Cyclobacteriaceae bacterium]
MKEDEKEMSFLDHLEELRWHVIRSLGAILVFMILAFVFHREIFDNVIFGPARPDFLSFRALCKLGHLIGFEEAMCIKEIPMKIQNRLMTGQFTMALTSSFIIGLIVAFPYVAWEVWRFIKPGLHSNERKYSRGAVGAISTLFFLGVSFGYYVMCPVSVYFLASFQISELIQNEFDIVSYVGTVVTLVFGSGLLFQLPVVVYFLARVGIVTADMLRAFRRHAIVVILVIAAVITPPDPISQSIVAIPLYMLYEFSIVIARFVERRKAEDEAEEEARDAAMNNTDET